MKMGVTDQTRVVAEENVVHKLTNEELLDDTINVSGDADEYVSLESLTTATHLRRTHVKLVEYSFSEENNDDVERKGEMENENFETEIENSEFLFEVELDTVPISMDGACGDII